MEAARERPLGQKLEHFPERDLEYCGSLALMMMNLSHPAHVTEHVLQIPNNSSINHINRITITP